MADKEAQKLTTAILAAIVWVISLVGLIVDFPEALGTPAGRISLSIIFACTLLYLGYFVYKSLIKRLSILEQTLNRIRSLIVQFTATQTIVDENIDLQLIDLLIATKKRINEKLDVKEITILPNENISITINKGFIHGYQGSMEFKIFHVQQLVELAKCGCTMAHDETHLVFPLPENCPIPINEIKKETIEVRLIEPSNNTLLNHLLAKLLFELEI